jgi:murein DD-endopeptidase MepM/ murein hydrolase activator NlpD
VHVLVVVVTFFLIFINLTTKTQAGGLTDVAGKTILADLISNEFSGAEEDEQFIIESFDKEAIISATQQAYLDNLDSFRPQPKVNMNEIGSNEELVEESMQTVQNGTSMVRKDQASTRISERARKETIEYIVQTGDSISTIAEMFGISASTILWENDLSAYSIIRPGDKLSILPESGLSHKVASGETVSSIAKKYSIDESQILLKNKFATDIVLQVGQKIFIPGGKKVSYPSYTPKVYSGFSAIKQLITSPNAAPVSGNKMNWPADATRITQYYSWRHTGLDIADKVGTAIYSADAGEVESAGWGKGYGNQIVIDHGGGKKTRYAHLSKFSVGVGDKVGKGEVIAAMGSTGWSTGSHLHFEVIINGTKYNPLNYIK